MSMMGTGASAQESVTVEWAPFIKAAGIPDADLIRAADTVNGEFLSRQPGFIKRELLKKSDTEYADLIHWQTNQDAESAGAKVEQCEPCLAYFALMDSQKSADAGAGFSHYSILKSW